MPHIAMNIVLLVAPGLTPLIPVWALPHLSAFLKAHGHKVKLFDYNVGYGIPMPHQGGLWWDLAFAEKYFASHPETKQRLLCDILSFQPDLVGFSVFKCCAGASMYLGRELKAMQKPPLVVFGGPQACRLPRESAFADAIVPAEGEKAMLDLVDVAAKRRPWGPVPGAIMLRGAQACYGGPPEEVQDLDSLPMPDFTGVDISAYSTKMTPFSFNRGCRNKCRFCTSCSLWPGFRSHSAKRIYEEMLHLKRRHGAGHMFASCTAVNLDRGVLDELCDRIISGGEHLSWEGLAVFHPGLNAPLLKKMAKAGCHYLSFGLESGSDTVLERMGKPFTSAIAAQVMRDAFAAGVDIGVNIILGFPGETEQETDETKAFLLENSKYLFGGISYPHECGIGGRSPMCFAPEKYGVNPATLENRLSWESADGSLTHQTRLERIRSFVEWARAAGIKIQDDPIAPPDVHTDSPHDPPLYGPP